MIDDALSATGAPVFAASRFRFTDQGVGLCVCFHHNAVDATGIIKVVRLWARSFSDPGFDFSNPPQDLFASQPEYSKAPPAMPTEFPSCTSELFKASIHRINVLKETLRSYMSNAPTTNVLLCALIWTTVTRVRAHPQSSYHKRNKSTGNSGQWSKVH
ncbi:hypothetical protein BDV41DRAFT_575800 [Aspergillus transmontanensis]|uniref:Transferase n=1 Tax=Aspergillus transmontanensis TaxID=1034304 RepID=A0A5N6W1N9_9EURO|nr:hypothetical protein BDV41DRAFT_575800 [Aspergillus transmontanensis]